MVSDSGSEAVKKLLYAYEQELNMKISDLVRETRALKKEVETIRYAWNQRLGKLKSQIVSEVKDILTTDYMVQSLPKRYNPIIQQVMAHIDMLEQRIDSLEAFCEELDRQGWLW